MGHHLIVYTDFINYPGEVSEWFKEPVLKTGDSERGRGFESHPLRQDTCREEHCAVKA